MNMSSLIGVEHVKEKPHFVFQRIRLFRITFFGFVNGSENGKSTDKSVKFKFFGSAYGSRFEKSGILFLLAWFEKFVNDVFFEWINFKLKTEIDLMRSCKVRSIL